MSPGRFEAMNQLQLRDDSAIEDSLGADKLAEVYDWVGANLVDPIHDAGWTGPLNALAHVLNPVSRCLSGKALIPKQSEWTDWSTSAVSQNRIVRDIAAGLAGMVPYVLAGKIMGSSMRAVGRVLQLEELSAKVLASERVAMMGGAAAYDFARDPEPGKKRWVDALGGAIAFGIIGRGNEFALTQESGLARYLWRLGTGALGADAQVLTTQAQQGKLLDRSTLAQLEDASIKGASMNCFLSRFQDHVNRAADSINYARGRGIPVDRFMAEEGLSGLSSTADYLARENPLARVQYSQQNSPEFRKNIAHIDLRIVEATAQIRSSEELARAAGSGGSKTTEEIRKEALVRELAAELHDIQAGRAGKSGSVLSNRGIINALKDGRLEVSIPTNTGGKPEYQAVELRQLLRQIGTNSLDLTLADRFVFLPEGQTLDLGTTHPADFLKTLPAQVRPGGVLLQPGEFVLAFTREKITLPSEAKPEWNGEPPLVGEINIQSSLARLGLSENVTASTLNNGTDNPITHEIKNNGTTAVQLSPGMRFGSVVFSRMSGPPGLGFQESRMHGQAEPNGVHADT